MKKHCYIFDDYDLDIISLCLSNMVCLEAIMVNFNYVYSNTNQIKRKILELDKSIPAEIERNYKNKDVILDHLRHTDHTIS